MNKTEHRLLVETFSYLLLAALTMLALLLYPSHSKASTDGINLTLPLPIDLSLPGVLSITPQSSQAGANGAASAEAVSDVAAGGGSVSAATQGSAGIAAASGTGGMDFNLTDVNTTGRGQAGGSANFESESGASTGQAGATANGTVQNEAALHQSLINFNLGGTGDVSVQLVRRSGAPGTGVQTSILLLTIDPLRLRLALPLNIGGISGNVQTGATAQQHLQAGLTPLSLNSQTAISLGLGLGLSQWGTDSPGGGDLGGPPAPGSGPGSPGAGPGGSSSITVQTTPLNSSGTVSGTTSFVSDYSGGLPFTGLPDSYLPGAAIVLATMILAAFSQDLRILHQEAWEHPRQLLPRTASARAAAACSHEVARAGKAYIVP